jgi:predicted enzyme related to lactoylglutathione lyase
MIMSIDNVLAAVAVTSLEEAVRWYARVLGAAPRRPMPELAEWKLSGGGALQVFEDKERAGRSSVTFVVDSVDDQIAQLTASGIAIVRTTNHKMVKTATVSDPDRNQVVFAQAIGDALVR